MVYVALNPIRAKMAPTPETSDHTSIKKRIQSVQSREDQPRRLMPFVGSPREPIPQGLPFRFENYQELMDWTGKILREDKRGVIFSDLPPILERLDIDPKHWLFLATKFESHFKGLVGGAYALKRRLRLWATREPGMTACKTVFTT